MIGYGVGVVYLNLIWSDMDYDTSGQGGVLLVTVTAPPHYEDQVGVTLSLPPLRLMAHLIIN